MSVRSFVDDDSNYIKTSVIIYYNQLYTDKFKKLSGYLHNEENLNQVAEEICDIEYYEVQELASIGTPDSAQIPNNKSEHVVTSNINNCKRKLIQNQNNKGNGLVIGSNFLKLKMYYYIIIVFQLKKI